MKTIAPEILEILSKLEITGKSVRITEPLDRGTYKLVNDVLTACGGKWDRKAKAHLFAEDAFERLDPVITSGQVLIPKNELGFFPTPVKLAQQLVEVAEVRPGSWCLEPSAGTGRIVDALLAAGAAVVFCERNLEQRLALYEHLGDLAEPYAGVGMVGEDDFLNYDPSVLKNFIPFGRIVMNPPFCKSGKGNHLDHVRHAFKLLAVGGKLVSVLPRSVEFRQDRSYRDFRAWYDGLDGMLTRLPDGSFKESGTMVSTNLLVITKGKGD